MKSDKRYWQTADKSRLVEEGDREARFLFAVEGDEISDEDAARYGLNVKRPKADAADLTAIEESRPDNSEPGEQIDGQGIGPVKEKAAEPKANKAKAGPENKGK